MKNNDGFVYLLCDATGRFFGIYSSHGNAEVAKANYSLPWVQLSITRKKLDEMP